MTITSIYAGVQQADVASMTIGGITYRCFGWVEAPDDNGPQRVGAAIFAEGEDGQLVLVDKSIVATAIGSLVDCPRVLAAASDSLFVIHWIDLDLSREPDTANLYRALFDVTAISSGWSNQGAVAIHETCQYDHATVEGDGDTEFVVSRRTASGTITTTRYSSPFSWGDIAWNDARAGLTIANTVLACHANASDNVVLVSYQDALLLRTYRLDADDGGTFATAETFPDVLDGDLRFAAVSHVRIGSGAYLVAAEAIDDVTFSGGSPLTNLRLVCWRQIASADASITYRSHWLKNVHLESRLWTWDSGVTGQLEAFCGWAFKTIYDGGEFNQMVGGVMRLDVQALDDYPETSGVIRPIPCSVVVNGTWDARPHGETPSTGDLSPGKRLNHLSHVTGPAAYTLGPYKKGMLFAHTRWARLALGEDGAEELVPVEAGIACHQFTHEPPWTLVRDPKEPAQPDTEAWRGVTPSHALPVETPAGLVWTGGVTTTYDGYQKTEMGFLFNVELRAQATSDGTPIGDAGDYYYTVTPIWIDARGNSHRGPPCTPVSVTIDATQGVNLDIRCINLTMKDDRARYPAAQRIYFEVYRTYISGAAIVEGDNGAIFRLIYGGSSAGAAQFQDMPASDHEEYFVEVLDAVPNTIVQYNDIAPFQIDLDTLLWTPPPPIPHQPLNVAALWQNRLFGVDPEGLLRWSEEILPRGADLRKPEFLDTNVMRLAGVDRVTGLVGLDNDLGLLHRDGVDQIAGDPGAGGSGNTLQQRVISRGYGCVEARSVCIFDGGATFQSAKRLHVLTRGSGVEDLGGPVEDAIRAGGNIRGVTYLEDRDELRFIYQATPGTGPLSVRPRVATYNVRSGLWTTRVLPLAGSISSASRLNEVMHSTRWRGLQGEDLHVVLFQGPGMIRERASSDTSYADEAASSSSAVRLDVTTEWITMGLDSTKRYPEIGIITERTHAGPLTIESWYDHDGSFDSDSGASEYTLTVASPAPAFIRFRPTPSKCRAIKLRIYEPSGAPSTENVRLVALVVHWMVKKQRQGSRNNAA